MKLLYNINKIALIITLILYATVILGLYAQIILGVLQIVCAFLLFFYWTKFSAKIKKHIYIYWITVLLYGLSWLLEWNHLNNEFVTIFGVMIIPMSIAIYFVFILKATKNDIT